jgi:hypothetical protein
MVRPVVVILVEVAFVVVPWSALYEKSVVDAWKILPPVKVLLVVVENARPLMK